MKHKHIPYLLTSCQIYVNDFNRIELCFMFIANEKSIGISIDEICMFM